MKVMEKRLTLKRYLGKGVCMITVEVERVGADEERTGDAEPR
jgi:hypothetical protein